MTTIDPDAPSANYGCADWGFQAQAWEVRMGETLPVSTTLGVYGGGICGDMPETWEPVEVPRCEWSPVDWSQMPSAPGTSEDAEKEEAENLADRRARVMRLKGLYESIETD